MMVYTHSMARANSASEKAGRIRAATVLGLNSDSLGNSASAKFFLRVPARAEVVGGWPVSALAMEDFREVWEFFTGSASWAEKMSAYRAAARLMSCVRLSMRAFSSFSKLSTASSRSSHARTGRAICWNFSLNTVPASLTSCRNTLLLRFITLKDSPLRSFSIMWLRMTLATGLFSSGSAYPSTLSSMSEAACDSTCPGSSTSS